MAQLSTFPLGSSEISRPHYLSASEPSAWPRGEAVASSQARQPSPPLLQSPRRLPQLLGPLPRLLREPRRRLLGPPRQPRPHPPVPHVMPPWPRREESR